MATALLADDEPLLLQDLGAQLARAWPGLQVLERVGDGEAALARALALRPDVVFLDIRMPGLDGLQAARELTHEWPAGEPFPAIVFVTAYEQHAVQAFELAAADYLLKPVDPGRLGRCVQRVQQLLAQRAADPDSAAAALRRLLLPPPAASQPPLPPLRIIQAGIGTTIHLVPIDEVVYFEAADKYVRVWTAEAEYLVRTPLKELQARLDPEQFWQVHRGTVVRAAAISAVHRDPRTGRLVLAMRDRPERLAVSRLHAQAFKAM
ncbi:response regulator transcription factor [Ramlibacter sp. AW1]|uniref:Response regulator transcription factor n=2 Tax=Ramlibacter aurantiacus TaxID=2801330 RepID=A0A936ZPD9_9BURK|nr:response regulator transcription factor [Ramlibacter aurantiacus]